MLDIASIRDCLAAGPAYPPIDFRVGRQAAVAILLRAADAAGGTEVLFIKRAEKRGDPWSGHMAFPGGHREPQDVDLCAAAIRETAEEIGLDLSCAPLLGTLPMQRPVTAMASRDMAVAPFVFAVDGSLALRFNHEVADAAWAPLEPMYHGDNRERGMPDGYARSFDGYRLDGGHFVWGITYRMMRSLFEAIAANARRCGGLLDPQPEAM